MSESRPVIKSKRPLYLKGPLSRSFELAFAWKVFRQTLAGNRALYFIGPCITVFGSARFKEDQKPNKYMQRWITFDYFFLRKVMLLKYSYAFIVMPGGFGTLDELFNTLTLIQTKSITQFPVVLFGKSYYKPLIEMIRKMESEKTIFAQDLDLLLITDDVEEAMNHINSYISVNYEIMKKRKRFWWLFEKKPF